MTVDTTIGDFLAPYWAQIHIAMGLLIVCIALYVFYKIISMKRANMKSVVARLLKMSNSAATREELESDIRLNLLYPFKPLSFSVSNHLTNFKDDSEAIEFQSDLLRKMNRHRDWIPAPDSPQDKGNGARARTQFTYVKDAS